MINAVFLHRILLSGGGTIIWTTQAWETISVNWEDITDMWEG